MAQELIKVAERTTISVDTDAWTPASGKVGKLMYLLIHFLTADKIFRIRNGSGGTEILILRQGDGTVPVPGGATVNNEGLGSGDGAESGFSTSIADGHFGFNGAMSVAATAAADRQVISANVADNYQRSIFKLPIFSITNSVPLHFDLPTVTSLIYTLYVVQDDA